MRDSSVVSGGPADDRLTCVFEMLVERLSNVEDALARAVEGMACQEFDRIRNDAGGPVLAPTLCGRSDVSVSMPFPPQSHRMPLSDAVLLVVCKESRFDEGLHQAGAGGAVDFAGLFLGAGGGDAVRFPQLACLLEQALGTDAVHRLRAEYAARRSPPRGEEQQQTQAQTQAPAQKHKPPSFTVDDWDYKTREFASLRARVGDHEWCCHYLVEALVREKHPDVLAVSYQSVCEDSVFLIRPDVAGSMMFGPRVLRRALHVVDGVYKLLHSRPPANLEVQVISGLPYGFDISEDGASTATVAAPPVRRPWLPFFQALVREASMRDLSTLFGSYSVNDRAAYGEFLADQRDGGSRTRAAAYRDCCLDRRGHRRGVAPLQSPFYMYMGWESWELCAAHALAHEPREG